MGKIPIVIEMIQDFERATYEYAFLIGRGPGVVVWG